MSLTVKLDEGALKSVFELKVNESTTVKELAKTIGSRRNCNEEQVEILLDGKSVTWDKSMADLGAAFLTNPQLSFKIWPRIKFGFSVSISTLTQRFGSPSDAFDLSPNDALDSMRFPVGSWVETKIKDSILVSEDSDEWCVGKVLEDTGTGYLIEVFENYKYLMPAKIKAADEDVRMPRQQTLKIARSKSNEFDEDDFKSAPSSIRGRRRTRSGGRKRSVEKQALSQKSPRKSFSHLPRPSNRSCSAENLKFKLSKSEMWDQNNRGKRVRRSTTPSQLSTRSLGAGYSSSNRRLSVASANYRANVREYTAKYPNLRPTEIKSYVRVFRSELDTRKRGAITKKQLSEWMKSNGIKVEVSTIDLLLASLDVKNDKDIDIGDFIAIMSTTKASKKDSEERKLFESFDLDGDGVISLAELKAGMKNVFGQDIPEDKLTRMIRQADTTGTGSVCFRDFIKMMRK